MNIIKNNVSNEIIINKSKFITYLYKIKNEEEAKNIIDNLKKDYNDATHICYSYIINNIKRFNDDGEPNGTAGMPILSVLEAKELNFVLAVVIRYFGGIKLGAGGLLRAYSNSISECLNKTEIIQYIKQNKMRIQFKYEYIDNINYILRNNNITYKEYDDYVIYEFIYNEGEYPIEIDKYIEKNRN